ncbi:hypothetical protein [Nonomuraea sp. KM90]|uniref:hypothetical protein n=1 Tax=Nonomuraea sp. KM90 TaxID=3457428 RepID=UPI003FCDA9C3
MTPTTSPSGTPTPSPSLVSPCPHSPKCPPPVCLPPSLRPTTAPTNANEPANASRERENPGGSSDLPGYETQAGYLDAFAGAMSATAQGVGLVRDRTPRFEGWNLAPLAGVPIVGLAFVGRFNRISDTWGDSAGILHGVLAADSGKITRSAQNYRNAENPGGDN